MKIVANENEHPDHLELLGIRMLFSGVARLMISLGARSLATGLQPFEFMKVDQRPISRLRWNAEPSRTFDSRVQR